MAFCKPWILNRPWVGLRPGPWRSSERQTTPASSGGEEKRRLTADTKPNQRLHERIVRSKARPELVGLWGEGCYGPVGRLEQRSNGFPPSAPKPAFCHDVQLRQRSIGHDGSPVKCQSREQRMGAQNEAPVGA